MDAAGQVYVLDWERDDIQQFAADGTFLAKFGGPGSGDGQLNDAAYLTIDAQGHLWVADYGNHRIVEFSGDGTFVQAFGGVDTETNAFSPQDVAVDEAGRVYAADLDNGQVQVFDADGALLAILDAGQTPAGTENLPYAIAVDAEGHLYVAGVAADFDSESNVQKFRLLPPLATG